MIFIFQGSLYYTPEARKLGKGVEEIEEGIPFQLILFSAFS
jgi:hypothetical protein